VRSATRLACALAAVLGLAPSAQAAGGGATERFPHASGDRVVFSLDAPAGNDVRLIGDFNGWDPDSTPLQRVQGSLWEASLGLAPGEYRYRFVVDGVPRLDPSNPDEARAGDGGASSHIRVLSDGQVSQGNLWWQRDQGTDRDWALHAGRRRGFDLGGSLSFNRVDGTTFWARPSFETSVPFAPTNTQRL
jgi:hypothetical protein